MDGIHDPAGIVPNALPLAVMPLLPPPPPLLLLQDARASDHTPAAQLVAAAWQIVQTTAANPNTSPLPGSAVGRSDLTAAAHQVRQQRPRPQQQWLDPSFPVDEDLAGSFPSKEVWDKQQRDGQQELAQQRQLRQQRQQDPLQEVLNGQPPEYPLVPGKGPFKAGSAQDLQCCWPQPLPGRRRFSWRVL